MNKIKPKTLSIIVVIVVLLLGFGLLKIGRISSQNSLLSDQVAQLTQVIKENDKKIEGDRELYTSLAARLHQEMKKVDKLEEMLKTGKKRK